MISKETPTKIAKKIGLAAGFGAARDKISLFHEDHLADMVLPISLQAVKIDAGGDWSAIVVGAVPYNLMVAGTLHLVDECLYLLSFEVIDSERDRRSSRKGVFDSCFGIKRIGVVLIEGTGNRGCDAVLLNGSSQPADDADIVERPAGIGQLHMRGLIGQPEAEIDALSGKVVKRDILAVPPVMLTGFFPDGLPIFLIGGDLHPCHIIKPFGVKMVIKSQI